MSTQTSVRSHFTSSILLWVRQDQPRQTGMNHWKGPHSGIISATPGLEEYRQIHLAGDNPGRWPRASDIETAIPRDRRVDGVAEVTFRSALAPLRGRKQTRLAYADEINVFRRTLFYAGLPGTSRWYGAGAGKAGSRALLYLRRREGTSGAAFRRLIRRSLVPALLQTGVLDELRTQVFLPWTAKTWDTPNVAHDNPKSQHLHASVMLGFADDAARARFFEEDAARLTGLLRSRVSAIHAYDVEVAVTYVEDGRILPTPHR